MDKALYSKAKIEDAGNICSKITEDATAQANLILASAEKERARIMEEASREAGNERKEALKKNDIEIGKMKQKIFSTLNLEKKKLFLGEKSRFIETVLEKVKEMAAEFRNDPGYKAFLEKAISEGVEVIGEREVSVLYSALDEKVIKGDFIKGAKGVSLEFKKCDFEDIGVIVQSKDSRLIYDNTFSARFKRLYDGIYMDLLKGEF